MPYRKKTTYRKKRPAKKSYTRKVARREAVKVMNQRTESKMFDGQITTATVDASATNTVFNLFYNYLSAAGITQGTDDIQYIGKMIKPSYLTIRGAVNGADNYNYLRCIILQVKAGSTVPLGSQILEFVGTVRAPFSPMSRRFDDTFRVIHDRLITIDQASRLSIPFKIKIPYRKMSKVRFYDASGTYEAGGLYMMWISDSTAATHPILNCSWRLHFRDA